MKKIIFPILALLLGFTFFPSSTQPTHAQEQIEIRFVHIFGDENDIRGAVVQELVNEFMTQRQDIRVVVETTLSDYEEVLNTTLLAAEQNNAPHLVQIDESSVQFVIDSELFVSISDIATEDQKASFGDILESVRNFYTIDGKLWSLPWNSSNPVMYYNKDMFTAAGLDPEAPPRTFAEIMTACDALMNAGLDIDGCINWPLTAWFMENWVAMQGALLVDNDNGRSARATETFFTSPEMLFVLNWWKELADKGYYGYSGNRIDYNGNAALFITRRYPIHLNSTAGISNFQYYANLIGYNIGVAPLPIPNEESTNGTVNGGASLWISAGYSEAETLAARDLAFFMTNSENIARWHKATGYFPNRQSSIDLLESEGFWDENPAYRIAVDQLLATTPSFATSGAVIGPSPRVREILDVAVQSVLDQGEDPQAALESAKRLADQELEDYNFFFSE